MVAMQHSTGRHHLGVEVRLCAKNTMKGPTMAVSPVHHGRNRQSMHLKLLHFFCTFNALNRFRVHRLYDAIRYYSLCFSVPLHT